MQQAVIIVVATNGALIGCRMLRSARTPHQLRSLVFRYRCYATAPVPAETLKTPELEKRDHVKELELRTRQAPNRLKTWAASQRPRSEAFNQPRFEGAILEMQVWPQWSLQSDGCSLGR